MKSKKRHHDSSEDSEESEVSGKSSSSSNSESDSSVSEHRYKKKKKRAESSDSESNSDDQKRVKKRKHKKKKKKHSKKKRRSDSVEDISDDNISISEGEISAKKKRKHKHKHSKRTRSTSGSEDNKGPVEHRLHSVVQERRASSEGSQHKRTYYQKEYRCSVSVEDYEREREVQRFYRGSSKDNRHQYQDSYDPDKSARYAPQPEKYDRPRERYSQNIQYQHPNEHYGRPKEYQDYKRPQRFEEDEYHKKQREDNYYREDPRAYANITQARRFGYFTATSNSPPVTMVAGKYPKRVRFNTYQGRGRRDFVENRQYRERRGPLEPERYREKEYPEKREGFPEERYSMERSRDMRRERPARVEKPPAPHHRIPSKSRSPEDRYREKRREVREDRERGEPSDKYRPERAERSREHKLDREGRTDREERGEPREPREDQRERRPPPDRSRERRTRFDNTDDKKEYSWGKTEVKKEGDGKDGEKEKPNFGLSGKLTADANTVNGVVIKYTEPDDAKQPKRRWRFYPFKGDKALPILYIHRQSCFVIGRDKKVVDIALDHPSISKQHAALQYRATPFTRADGSTGRRVRPYVIDLESANGTFVNNKKLDPRRYVELLERDVVKFGFSQREYVLLHENSTDGDQDDDRDPAPATTDQVKQVKRVKEEEAADG